MKFSWVIIPLFLLGCSTTQPPKLDCSFAQAPYINPRVIQELSPWLSDNHDQVVAVDLIHSQKSNRFFCEAKIRNIKDQNPFVYVESEDKNNPGFFGYQYVGKSDSGLYVLLISENGGGTGDFKKLMFLKLEQDRAAVVDWTNGVVKMNEPRILLKKVGEVALGDRWDGELKVVGDSILIGKDRGSYSGSANDKTISLKIVGRP